MGARDLSDAVMRLAGVFLCASVAVAQTPPTRAEIESHRVCVHGERVVRFLNDYAARSADVRKLAEFTLEKRRAAGGSVEWTPNDEALYFAWRQLLDEEGEGGQSDQALELQKLAALLDLAVVPGVFAARDDGLGEALTVFVRPTTPITIKHDFTMSLEWITPSLGQVHARREPIGPEALRDGGFEMYLRAPASKPGAWQLFGLASRDTAGAVAGALPAVGVDCIADLAPRSERALAPREGEPAGRMQLKRAFELVRHFGLRTTPSAGATRLLETLEAWTAEAPPADVPVPNELAFTDPNGAEHWVWSSRPSYETRGTLLLLASHSESVDTVFARGIGTKWLELARSHGLRVRATHLPYELRTAAGLIDRERGLASGELIVVARGDTLGRLGVAMQGREKLPFDALVLSTVVVNPSPETAFAGVDRLLVSPGAEKAVAGDASFRWVEGAWVPLLNEPRLPELVAAWLEARAAANKVGR